MVKKLLLTFCLIILLSISFISAELIVGDTNINNKIVELVTDIPLNVTTGLLVFNMSDIWVTNEGNMDNVPDLYPTLDLRYLELDGSNFGFSTPYLSYSNPNFDFNEVKLNATIGDLTKTTFFNTSTIQVVTGTPQGAIADIQSYNNLPYNLSEVNSDLELRLNFTGITEFNQLIIRYRSVEEDEPHTMLVQIWDYIEGIWEDYGTLPANNVYHILEIGVYDFDEHIGTGVNDGVVQLRFYQLEGVPNKQHKHNFDWVTIAKGFGTPSGQEVDPDFNAWLQNPILTNSLNLSGNNITNVDWGFFKNINVSETSYLGSTIIEAENITASFFNGKLYGAWNGSINYMLASDIISSLYGNLSNYLLANGSRQLTGNWDVGGNITNISYLNVNRSVLSVSKTPAGTISIRTQNDISVVIPLKIETISYTNPPYAGLGTGISFFIQDAGGSEKQAEIEYVLTTVTDNSEDVDTHFRSNIDGTMTTWLRHDASADSIFFTPNMSIYNIQNISGRLPFGGSKLLYFDCISQTADCSSDNAHYIDLTAMNIYMQGETNFIDTEGDVTLKVLSNKFGGGGLLLDGAYKTLANEPFIFGYNDQAGAGETLEIKFGSVQGSYPDYIYPFSPVTILGVPKSATYVLGNETGVTWNILVIAENGTIGERMVIGVNSFNGVGIGGLNLTTLHYDTLTAKSHHMFSPSPEYNYTGFCVFDELGFWNLVTWVNGSINLRERDSKYCKDKLNKIELQETNYNTWQTNKENCEDNSHSYPTFKEYQSGNTDCYLNCKLPYQYESNGDCVDNLFLKCVNNKTKVWNETTNKCDVNQEVVCELQEDMRWDDKTETCSFSQVKQDSRLMKECLEDKSKVWINDECVNANNLSP